MATPSSVSTRIEEDEPGWGRAPKRRKGALPADASNPSPREIGFMRESQNDGSASFLGSSSGIHFIRHVYSAFARRSADLQQTRARDRTSVPGEDDRLHRGPGGNLDANEIWLAEELDYSMHTLLSFENLIRWTRLYFENWHPIFPCLHAPTILKVMEKIGQQGLDSVDRLDAIIIRCIVSISLADSRQTNMSGSTPGPVPVALLFHSVQHIMQDIHSLLAEPTTLPLLQAAFTAQLTLASLLRLNAASRVGGVITRTAFHLGLHRCPGRFACFSDEEAQIRRRLFWSIYSLERYLSQALGVPLSIRDDDIDVCYPGDERHAGANAGPPDASHLRLLSYLAKFARIRGLILELRNKSILHSHAGTVEASHVNGELSQWWNEVYDDVHPIDEDSSAPSEPGTTLAPYHRLLLIVFRHEAIISMNRPLLASDKPNAEYKNALQTCIASSRSLLAALKQYMSSSSEAPLTWPSFTWTTWMASLILMYASWEGELPIPTALKYARIGISVLQNLALRGSSWPETCIEAIRSMESALQSNASERHEEPASGIFTAEKGGLLNSNGSPNLNESSIRDRNGQSNRRRSTFTTSDPQGAGMARNAPLSTKEQHFAASMGPGRPEVTSNEPNNYPGISPSDHASTGVDASFVDNYSLNGQTSGGLIFGNMMANTNAPFCPGGVGQDAVPFSDPSVFMNDLWSVADGPWLIDGNLL
ncbi:transcriptional regulator family: Fungal Specific TF [Penicillium herquei]|nr:transcriptional regulator family: Fungal Specific TF [Penicillium herquei]